MPLPTTINPNNNLYFSNSAFRKSILILGLISLFQIGMKGQYTEVLKALPTLASEDYVQAQAGKSVAVDGNLAVIGAPGVNSNRGKVYFLAKENGAWIPKGEMFAFDQANSSYYGNSVAVSGNSVLVGSYRKRENGISQSGAVYLYEFDGTTLQFKQKLTASDLANGDKFGSSVAISGNKIIVGAEEEDANGNSNAGSAYLFDYDGTTAVETNKITASDGEGNDFFGSAVAISGNYVVIGAHRENQMGSWAGAVYFYEIDGSNVIEKSKIVANDGSAYARFGFSVSISGNIFVVGAYEDDEIADNAGACYVYEYNGTSITLKQKVLPNDGQKRDYFGSSVSISGNNIIVGAKGDDDVANGAGSGYLFEYNGTTVTQKQKFLASDGASGNTFGDAVAASGNDILIGAPGKTDLASGVGGAYVFEYNGTTVLEKLIASPPPLITFNKQYFGSAVAVHENLAVVGSRGFSNDKGCAFVYENVYGHWLLRDTIFASDGKSNDYFGSAVDIYGKTIVIGANGNDEEGNQAGAVYVYEYADTGAIEKQKILASDGAANDYFGISISIDDTLLLIGAYKEGSGASNAGSAYLFEIANWTATEKSKMFANDAAPYDEFGFAVDISGNTMIIGAKGDDDLGSNEGSAYIFEYDGTSCTQQEKIVAPTANGGAGFGYSVSIDKNLIIIGAPFDNRISSRNGASYLYDYTASVLTLKETFFDNNAQSNDWLGVSVHLMDTNLIIGTRSGNDNPQYHGAVFTYAYDGTNTNQTQKVLGSNANSNNYFGVSVKADGHHLIVGAEGDSKEGTNAGAGYFFTNCTLVNQTVSNFTSKPCLGTAITADLGGSQSSAKYAIYNPNGKRVSDFVTGTGNAISLASPDTVTLSGRYIILAEDINDSTCVLRLNTIYNAPLAENTFATDIQDHCDSYTWINGETYTQSNSSAKDTLTNAAGCDSIITLNLTIRHKTDSIWNIDTCDTYTWSHNGQTYTQSTTVTTTIPNKANCDSIATLNLIIRHKTDSIWNIDTCDTYTWSQNGQTYTQSTSVKDTIPNKAGCDSIATLNLIIRYKSDSIWNVDTCDTYTWSQNGKTYIQSTTVKDTIPNKAGCDSIATLNLIIRHKSDSIWNIDTCDTYTWSQNGQTYVQSTTVKDTIPNKAGCDSIATLNLIIRHKTDSIWNIDRCDTYTWSHNGETYSQSTTVKDTIPNKAGCDSIATLNLIIRYKSDSIWNVDRCDSYTWSQNGQTYLQSTVVKDTIPNKAGCDSIATLNLIIRHKTDSIWNINTCDTYTWSQNGQTYTQSTTVKDTIANSVGCDSIATLNLIIRNKTFGTETVVTCDPFTWIDGNTYTESNTTAKHTLQNAAGCDSIVSLNLTNNSNGSVEEIDACVSYTWRDGNTYTENNYSATITLPNSLGCDSTIRLSLTLHQPKKSVEYLRACDQFTWTDGFTYTSTQFLREDTLTTLWGCDSIIHVFLDLRESTYGTDQITTCDSLVWIDGNTYTSSNNTAKDTIQNAAGCDSIVTLNLTIIDSDLRTDKFTACESFTWQNGITYTESTSSPSLSFINSFGCDSVVQLDLTILPKFTTDTIVACDNYTWTDGKTYLNSNYTARDSMKNSLGCDSIVLLHLTLGNTESFVDEVVACDEYTWINGVSYTSNNNSASFLYTSQYGCDSLIYLDLTINTTPTAQYTASNDSLTAIGTSLDFQWVDCNLNFAAMLGETDSLFVAPYSGNFGLITSQNNCADTSACIPLIAVGIMEVGNNQTLLYPNPNQGEFTLDFGVMEATEIALYNAQGKLLLHEKQSRGLHHFELNLASGIYYLQFVQNQQAQAVRFIVE